MKHNPSKLKRASLNHTFRLVWSEARQMFIAVAEHCRSRGKAGSGVVAAVVVSVGAWGNAYALDPGALPSGAQLTAGAAAIRQVGTTLNVDQSTQRAAINWQRFEVGRDARVNFNQPDANAVTLNRVVGNERSVIEGAINANGNVWIVNSAGVLFNRSAQVNVGGLVASTNDISDADFMDGKSTFERNGGGGSIINLGTLSAASEGHIALLGQQVANEGVIHATMGSAILAAGDKITLNFNGNSVVGVTIDRGALDALVENRHAIIADGGMVTLTAKGLDEVMRTVVNNTGEVRAQSIEQREGRIFLLGEADNNRVEVSGRLDASAPKSGTGGQIEVLADAVTMNTDATITASGASGGGEILVGGNYLGQGPQRNAREVVIERGARIEADAAERGDGGRVIVWSDESTKFAGRISARGGAEGGDGGFVETSSKKRLVVTGRVTTAAPKGKAGSWLLDPEDVEIGTEQSSGATSQETSAGQESGASENSAEETVASVSSDVAENAAASAETDTAADGSASASSDDTENQAVAQDSAPTAEPDGVSSESSDGTEAPAAAGDDDAPALAETTGEDEATATAETTDKSTTETSAEAPVEQQPVAQTEPDTTNDGGSFISAEAIAEALAEGSEVTVLSSGEISGAESVEGGEGSLTLLSHTTPEELLADPGAPGTAREPDEAPAVPTTERLVQTFYLEGGDVNLSSLAFNLTGYEVVIRGCQMTCDTGTTQGSVYIDDLSGLSGLHVWDAANVMLSGVLQIGGVINIHTGLVLSGTNLLISSNALNLAGPISVADSVLASGGANLTITAAAPTTDIVVGGAVEHADSALLISGDTLANLNQAPVASLTLGGAEQTGEIRVSDTLQSTGSLTLQTSTRINVDTTGTLVASDVSLIADTAVVAGSISVASDTGSAGSITIEAQHVHLQSTAKLDASGTASGGAVSIGANTATHAAAAEVAIHAGANVDASSPTPGAGGTIAIAAETLTQAGTLLANGGAVLLGAGGTVLLDPNAARPVDIRQGANQASLINTGLIQADGGLVYLSAQASATDTTTVLENNGTVRARTLATGERGRIYLMGDMENDRIEVAGTLDASAPEGGDGGFIETSAANVQIKEGLSVTTAAPDGQSGMWLIDPTDIYIVSGANVPGQLSGNPATNSGSTVHAATINNALAASNVTITTASGGTDAGDIHVNAGISWSSNNDLTLRADRNIFINDLISATGATAKLTLEYGQGAVAADNTSTYSFGLTPTGFTGRINLQAGQNFDTKLGSDGSVVNWTVITALGAQGDESNAGATNSLQGLAHSSRLNGNFVLGADIDAAATSGWNPNVFTVNQGFRSIGDATTAFTGQFNGLGNTVSNLTINRTDNGISNQGLFGVTSGANLSNIGLEGGGVRGTFLWTGALVGDARTGTTINNAFATTAVAGNIGTGGLVGQVSGGSIANSFATGSVSGNTGVNNNGVGGLAGNVDNSTITRSFATGSVNGRFEVGGLVGLLRATSTITESFATGVVSGNIDTVGGLVGWSAGTINNSYATGAANGQTSVGGLVGHLSGATATISNSYSVGAVGGTASSGGLVGQKSSTDSTVTDSYWNLDTSNRTVSAGGVGKTTAEMSQIITFRGADPDSPVWNIVAADVAGPYPTLRWASGLNGESVWVMPYAVAADATFADTILLTGESVTNELGTLSLINGVLNASLITQEQIDAGYIAADFKAGNVAIVNRAGDMNIDQNFSWSNFNLTLEALGNVNVNALISAKENTTLVIKTGFDGTTYSSQDLTFVKMAMDPVTGVFSGKLSFVDSEGNLRGGDGILTIDGQAYTLINTLGASHTDTTLGTLQGMQNGLTRNYALAGDINAGASMDWDGMKGFNPIAGGDGNSDYFSGSFNGLGHSINALTFQRPSENKVGLFGKILSTSPESSISNVRLASTYVSGGDYVGALAGELKQDVNKTLTVFNVSSSGTVMSSNNGGGLVGGWEDAKGENLVSSAGVSANMNAGGLIGIAFGGELNTVLASGAVQGINASQQNTGGLIGIAFDTQITRGTATGAVTGQDFVGGLIGSLNGESQIMESHSTGAVTGSGNQIGGLVGGAEGASGKPFTIGDSYSTSNVTGGGFDSQGVGGLIGIARFGGTVTRNYATGTVSNANKIGGLIGDVWNVTVDQNYATGNVTGQAGASDIGLYAGGLVGWAYEDFATSTILSNNFATGSVGFSGTVVTTPTPRPVFLGGLVGMVLGAKVSNSYASGTVTTPDPTTEGLSGGLFGFFESNGTVIASSIDNFWNTQTTGQTNAYHIAGATPGTADAVLSVAGSASGINTAQMSDIITFRGGNPSTPVWNIASADVAGPFPMLRWSTEAGGTAIWVMPFKTAQIVFGSDILENSAITTANAISGGSGTLTLDSNNQLILSGASFSVPTGYLAEDFRADAKIVDSDTLNIDNAFTWNGFNLTLSAADNILIRSVIEATGATDKLTIEYGQGAVAADNTSVYDFGLSETGFAGRINLQAGQNFDTKLGSDGSVVNWTVITELGNEGDESVAGATNSLQGLAHHSRLSGNFVLGTDIDASATTGWNSGAGFVPIDDWMNSAYFSGRFDGLGNSVSNLFINRNATNDVGLFGIVGSTDGSTVIRNVALENVDIQGRNRTGALVGRVWNDDSKASTFSSILTSGSVKGEELAGGVIGLFQDSNRSRPLIMRDIFSSADVLATNSTAGGIIGQIERATVDLRNLHASGDITVGDASSQNTFGWAGGLIGSAYYLEGSIENVSASGDVSATGDIGSDFKHMGGLFGELIGYEYLDQPEGLRVTNASSSGNVTSGTHGVGESIGGLVGFMQDARLQDASVAEGVVVSAGGKNMVGGLVGFAKWSIIDNASTAASVTGQEMVGGLVGRAQGGAINSSGQPTLLSSISNSSATGDVLGTLNVGGFVGTNEYATISRSFATGDVTGSSSVGGFAGHTVSNKFAADLVQGLIDESYYIGTVKAEGASFGNVGGFVGYNLGSVIRNSFAKATIVLDSASTTPVIEGVGGFVGQHRTGRDGDTARIENSYAVSTFELNGFTPTDFGGFSGLHDELDGAVFVENSFWNTDTSALVNSAGGTGRTTEQMSDILTYRGSDPTNPVWNIVTANVEGPYPQLRWAAGLDGTAIWVMPALSTGFATFDGSILTSTGPGSVTSNGSTLALTGGNLLFTPGAITLTQEQIDAGYLVSDFTLGGVRIVNETGNLVIDRGFTWTDYVLNLESSQDILVNSLITAGANTQLNIRTGYNFNTGSPVFDTQYALRMKLNPATDSFDGSIRFVDGNGDLRGGENILTINNLAYTLINRIGTDANDVSIGSLQGMQADVDKNYALAGDIDAAASSGWGANGFKPVGIFDLMSTDEYFTGRFNGLGNIISDLRINRPNEDGVGLFGATRDAGGIANVGLMNASITGREYVGGLVGYLGTVSTPTFVLNNSFVNGTVTADSGNVANRGGNVGGLIGINYAGLDLSESYVKGTVSGDRGNVGGLVGAHDPLGRAVDLKIYRSFFDGNINALGTDGYVGGLIGRINGRVGAANEIRESYAKFGDIFASAQNNVGGLVGGGFAIAGFDDIDGAMVDIFQSFATGVLWGNTNLGGLVGTLASDSRIENSFARVNLVSIPNSSLNIAVDSVGGLVGFLRDNAQVINSYAVGTFSDRTAPNVGGLIGRAGSNTAVTESFWDVEVSQLGTAGETTGSAGGVGRSTAEMQQLATFDGATWSIVGDPNRAPGYPTLAWVDGTNSPVWVIGTQGTGGGDGGGGGGGGVTPPVDPTPVDPPPVEPPPVEPPPVEPPPVNPPPVEPPPPVRPPVKPLPPNWSGLPSDVHEALEQAIAGVQSHLNDSIPPRPMLPGELPEELAALMGRGSNVVNAPQPVLDTLGDGDDLMLLGTPRSGEPNAVVTLPEAWSMLGLQAPPVRNEEDEEEDEDQTEEDGQDGSADEGDRRVRVPAARNSLVDIVDGGQRLPAGVQQQLFVTKK